MISIEWGFFKWGKVKTLEAMIQPLLTYIPDHFHDVVKIKIQKLEGEKRLFIVASDSVRYNDQLQSLTALLKGKWKETETELFHGESMDPESPLGRSQILRKLYKKLAIELPREHAMESTRSSAIDAAYLNAHLAKQQLKPLWSLKKAS